MAYVRWTALCQNATPIAFAVGMLVCSPQAYASDDCAPIKPAVDIDTLDIFCSPFAEQRIEPKQIKIAQLCACGPAENGRYRVCLRGQEVWVSSYQFKVVFSNPAPPRPFVQPETEPAGVMMSAPAAHEAVAVAQPFEPLSAKQSAPHEAMAAGQSFEPSGGQADVRLSAKPPAPRKVVPAAALAGCQCKDIRPKECR